MSAFTDEMLLRFLDNAFVEGLLKDQLGLSTLFAATYETEDIDLKEISLASVQSLRFEMPAFETIRTTGTDERIMPDSQRIKVDRAQPRYGRLAWIDVMLDLLVSTKVALKNMPVEKITVQNLLDKLNGPASVEDLKSKLAALYPRSIVEAFLEKFRIISVEDFKKQPGLFLEFVYKAPKPFDPNDPQNVRTFRLNVCVQFQPELKISEAMQSAKLCRSILENERDFVEVFDGGEIEKPYAFVVIFADSAVVDKALPNLTADQIKTRVKGLFQAERMLAHFG